jgi:DNA-directed RNA polymerase I, II, and III subunit RPABC2
MMVMKLGESRTPFFFGALSSRFFPFKQSKASPHILTGFKFSFDYEAGEAEYDAHEPEDFLEPEDDAEGYDGAGAEDAFSHAVNGERTIISGDPNAGGGRGGIEQPREKKIPNDQRTTTPYMTKYERARVLGTRALQIRLEILLLPMNLREF